jgi:hypothetical protein
MFVGFLMMKLGSGDSKRGRSEDAAGDEVPEFVGCSLNKYHDTLGDLGSHPVQTTCSLGSWPLRLVVGIVFRVDREIVVARFARNYWLT